MDGREIPGFYFDKEKKKYFKIQNPHTVPPPGSKYSLENVRKEQKKEKALKDEAARLSKCRKETVVRKYSRDFLTRASLDREIGCRRRSYYLQNVWPDACASGLQHRPQKVVERPEEASIRLFDRDPATKTLYAVYGENRIKRRRLNTPDGVPLPSVDLDLGDYGDAVPLNEYSFEPWDELARLTSPISSLNYLPASGALAATTYGSDRPPVVYLSDPDRDGPYVNQQFTPKSCTAIWGAASRPETFAHSDTVPATQTESLAVAASHSLLLFTRSPSGSWDSSTVLHSDADILAVDWLNPATIVLGCRDGKIRLYDTRSNGSSHILTHPYPVSRLRRADDLTRILCAGLQDSLFLYDIRFSRNKGNQHYSEQYFQSLNPEIRYSRKRRRLNRITSKGWSQPILSFQQSNPDDLELDMDVDPRLGLIAAAQDPSTSSAVVRVHNMWTGKTVKEFRHDGGKDKSAESRIRCLKFMEGNEFGDISLWATWNGGIARFGW